MTRVIPLFPTVKNCYKFRIIAQTAYLISNKYTEDMYLFELFMSFFVNSGSLFINKQKMDFQKLNVYKTAQELNKDVTKFLNSSNDIDIYLSQQLKNLSIHIITDIAKGTDKYSKGNKKEFLANARSSVSSCVCMLDILHDTDDIDQDKYNYFFDQYVIISKMLYGLINHSAKKKEEKNHTEEKAK